MESQLSSGKAWLEQLLDLVGLAAKVETEGFETIADDSDANWLSISGSDLTDAQQQQLLGNKGEGINAIQHLANTILNLDTDTEQQSLFVIDIDGYRVKRHQELITITQNAIAKVQETGEEIEIPDLSSAERKQIHSLVEDTDGLRSESQGQEPHRKLILLPE